MTSELRPMEGCADTAIRYRAGYYGDQDQPGASPKGATTRNLTVGVRANDLVRQTGGEAEGLRGKRRAAMLATGHQVAPIRSKLALATRSGCDGPV